jgi:hypothetical protein
MGLGGRGGWGGGGGLCVDLTNLVPVCGDWKSGILEILETSGPEQGLLYYSMSYFQCKELSSS